MFCKEHVFPALYFHKTYLGCSKQGTLLANALQCSKHCNVNGVLQVNKAHLLLPFTHVLLALQFRKDYLIVVSKVSSLQIHCNAVNRSIKQRVVIFLKMSWCKATLDAERGWKLFYLHFLLFCKPRQKNDVMNTWWYRQKQKR